MKIKLKFFDLAVTIMPEAILCHGDLEIPLGEVTTIEHGTNIADDEPEVTLKGIDWAIRIQVGGRHQVDIS